jgi:hypothetical protein
MQQVGIFRLGLAQSEIGIYNSRTFP